MDLKSYFESGLQYESYIKLLGDNLALHNLHYRKAELPQAGYLANSSPVKVNILVITEPWCGDSLALLPLVRKLAENNPDWQMRIVLRDENPDLIDRFLTNGSRGIPIFLFLDERFNLLFKWGPRPAAAQDIFEHYRADIISGKMEKPEVLKKIRSFYARDRGNAAYMELAVRLEKQDGNEVPAEINRN